MVKNCDQNSRKCKGNLVNNCSKITDENLFRSHLREGPPGDLVHHFRRSMRSQVHQPVKSMIENCMKKLNHTFPLGFFLLNASGFCCCLHGAETPAVKAPAASWSKPVWLTDLSLGIKESYDDNVFFSGVDPKYYPAYTVPAGSVAAVENHSSWVTTVSPGVGVNFAPLLGNQQVLKTLSLGYSPDFVIYHDENSESYDAHRFITATKAQIDHFSFSVDNALTYISGSDFGPTYPGAFINAYNTAALRERREQIQDRATAVVQYDLGKWFFRPTASLLYYDLMTEQLNVTGYQNYVDRYDVNGGGDVGYRVLPQLAVTLGYRYGHQYHQQFSFSPYSAPSDYQRALLGVEGKPWKWLDVKIQAGPDFRDYPGNTATHITPVNDYHPIKFYGEARVTATFTPKDSVTFKFKEWEWVSSIGKIPYLDSTYDLSYHRILTDKLSFDLGGRILGSDYTGGNLPNCQRNDLQYTVSASLGYAFNKHLGATLSYALDLGRNAENGLSAAQIDQREYDHQLISLGVQAKF